MQSKESDINEIMEQIVQFSEDRAHPINQGENSLIL